VGLFDRHAALLADYRDVQTTGADPFQVRMDRVLSPTEAIIDGRKTLLVGTHNYFGLTFDPSCMEAAIEATRSEGTGTTGSRIANGSYGEHALLEREIAEFYGKKHCMVFTTGYQANLGAISGPTATPRSTTPAGRPRPRSCASGTTTPRASTPASRG
jgi:8-amino-7-oxononanoate synthase